MSQVSYIPASALSPTVPFRRRTDGIGTWMSFCGTFIAWMIPAGILVGLSIFVAKEVELALFLGTFGILVAALVILFCVRHMFREAHHRNGRAILEYVDMATRLNLPLVPFLGAASRSESSRCAEQLRRIRHLLAAGLPLSRAMADARDVPDDALMRLEAAEPLGQLPQALALSLQQERQKIPDETANAEGWLFQLYPLYMGFAMVFVVSFVMIFLMPKFYEIFKDFRTTMPPLTSFLINVSHTLATDWYITLPLLLLLTGAAVLTLTPMLNQVFLPIVRQPNLRRLGAWFAWRLPPFRTLERDHSIAEVCALLADAQRGGVPLPTALATAQQLPINAGFRNNLAQFRTHLESGQSPPDAARNAGMPEFFSGMLACSPGRPLDAELFSFLHRYYRNRFSRLALLLRGAVEPAMVLAFGLLVGAIVVGLFLPLVKLIQSVSGAGDGGVL